MKQVTNGTETDIDIPRLVLQVTLGTQTDINIDTFCAVIDTWYRDRHKYMNVLRSM